MSFTQNDYGDMGPMPTKIAFDTLDHVLLRAMPPSPATM